MPAPAPAPAMTTSSSTSSDEEVIWVVAGRQSSAGPYGDNRFHYVPDREIARRLYDSWRYATKIDDDLAPRPFFVDYFGGYTGVQLESYYVEHFNMTDLILKVNEKPYKDHSDMQRSLMISSFKKHVQKKAQDMIKYLTEEGRCTVCPIGDGQTEKLHVYRSIC
jgi:hypothetical protein